MGFNQPNPPINRVEDILRRAYGKRSKITYKNMKVLPFAQAVRTSVLRPLQGKVPATSLCSLAKYH